MADAVIDSITVLSDICVFDFGSRTDLANLIFQVLPSDPSWKLIVFWLARPSGIPDKTYVLDEQSVQIIGLCLLRFRTTLGTSWHGDQADGRTRYEEDDFQKPVQKNDPAERSRLAKQLPL